jgi:hypothetical protein
MSLRRGYLGAFLALALPVLPASAQAHADPAEEEYVMVAVAEDGTLWEGTFIVVLTGDANDGNFETKLWDMLAPCGFELVAYTDQGSKFGWTYGQVGVIGAFEEDELMYNTLEAVQACVPEAFPEWGFYRGE